MARAKEPRNGRLEEAMAMLIQAAFLARMAESDRQFRETERLNAERFARIETILLDHSRILAEHSRILAALPETIRPKKSASNRLNNRETHPFIKVGWRNRLGGLFSDGLSFL
jgi:hypothetical protein